MTMISKAMEQLPPPDIRHTWAQAPVTLEDALGRRLPVPSEYDWTVSSSLHVSSKELRHLDVACCHSGKVSRRPRLC